MTPTTYADGMRSFLAELRQDFSDAVKMALEDDEPAESLVTQIRFDRLMRPIGCGRE